MTLFHQLPLTRTLIKIGIVPVNLICQWEMFASSYSRNIQILGFSKIKESIFWTLLLRKLFPYKTLPRSLKKSNAMHRMGEDNLLRLFISTLEVLVV